MLISDPGRVSWHWNCTGLKTEKVSAWRGLQTRGGPGRVREVRLAEGRI